MPNFEELLVTRRSVRKFSDELLHPEQIQKIVEAGLLSPTSKNQHSWEFILVEDKELLEKLSNSKPTGCAFVKDAAFAVLVMGNPLLSEAWIEDASIAAINMQWQATELNIGSCWVQVRERSHSDVVSSQDYLSEIFDITMPLEVVCIIAFGNKLSESEPRSKDDLHWEKVHISKYQQR